MHLPELNLLDEVLILRLIQKVEKNNMTVLVTGQSGTGKELVARSIHENSKKHWDLACKPIRTVVR